MEFLHPAMWHDHDIDFARWLHHAMWHVALESWQWIHQVAAPCNVIRGSGMTYHWIRPNVRHIGILHLVSISTTSPQSTVILHQSPKFYPNWTTLGRTKMTSCRLSRWRISAILDFRGPIMGSLKSSCTTSYRSSIDTKFWRQTDEQINSTDALSRSRYRERRLKQYLRT